MRLGIDLDGVVADFNAGWMRLYNQDFGAALTPDLVDDWDVIPSLTRFESMGDFWRWARGTEARPSIFRSLPTFPDAVPTLERLAAAGHSIVILTTKPPWAVDDTREWIAEQRLPTTEIHILEEKWLVDADVYLDDGPHVLPGLVRHRPDRLVCRYVRPWNEPIPGAVDVANFAEFREVLNRRTSA